MSFRHVVIKRAKHLSLKQNSLLIHRGDENTVSIPLEDISLILLEDPNTTITSRIISELSKHSISLILCDETFMPNTQTIALNQHYNQLAVLKKQLGMSAGFKGEIWKKIIRSKISNQSKVIDLTSEDEHSRGILYKYIHEIKPNDVDNKEGIAAKVFFTSLYGTDFTRFSESSISKALDYGYTIFTNTMVRHLVAFGFNTALGIWHDSEKNAINLACDLVEPFRPVIDYFVYWNKDVLTNELSTDVRRRMIELLSARVEVDGKRCTVDYAMQLLVRGLVNLLNTGDMDAMKFPRIIPTDMSEDAVI